MTEPEKLLTLFEPDPNLIFCDLTNKSNKYAGNLYSLFVTGLLLTNAKTLKTFFVVNRNKAEKYKVLDEKLKLINEKCCLGK